MMSKFTEGENKLSVVLDRFEGETAVLTYENTQIALPKKILPQGAREGDVFYLVIRSSGIERKERENIAREILNELLGSDKEK